jgi:ketosteroid isomerase-like protein
MEGLSKWSSSSTANPIRPSQLQQTVIERAMNATPSELMMRNFNEIFVALNPAKRLAVLTESFAEDCLWIHPGGRIVGREGINEAATEIRKHFPQYRYTVTSEVQTMRNVATCRWGSGMPGQPFHYTGTDFLEERDGRVSRLYTFIDQKLFTGERA